MVLVALVVVAIILSVPPEILTTARGATVLRATPLLYIPTLRLPDSVNVPPERLIVPTPLGVATATLARVVFPETLIAPALIFKVPVPSLEPIVMAL